MAKGKVNTDAEGVEDEDMFSDEALEVSGQSYEVRAPKTLRERQQEYAESADDEVIHIVYKHAGGVFTGAKEVVGRIDDVAVMDEHDVGTRYGSGCFTVHSYFRSNAQPEQRIVWRARVGRQYDKTAEPVAQVAPVVERGPVSEVAGVLTLLEQLVGLTAKLQPPPQPNQLEGAMGVLSKGIEGMMSVVATTMRQAVKVQAERLIDEPSPPQDAPGAGNGLEGMDLRALLDAVGGLPGIMSMIRGGGVGGQGGAA